MPELSNGSRMAVGNWLVARRDVWMVLTGTQVELAAASTLICPTNLIPRRALLATKISPIAKKAPSAKISVAQSIIDEVAIVQPSEHSQPPPLEHQSATRLRQAPQCTGTVLGLPIYTAYKPVQKWSTLCVCLQQGCM